MTCSKPPAEQHSHSSRADPPNKLRRTLRTLLFRSFVALGMDDPAWDATPFGRNGDRRLEGDVARAFFDAVLE